MVTRRKRSMAWYARSQQRYAILKRIGFPGPQCKHGARDAARFSELVRTVGRDPAEWGTLGVRLIGGHARRTEDPYRLQCTARYHDLRRRGLTAMQASRCMTRGAHAKALRHLEQGIPLWI